MIFRASGVEDRDVGIGRCVVDAARQPFRDIAIANPRPGGKRPTPAGVMKIVDGANFQKSCGLSRSKHAYIKDLASHFHADSFPTRRVPRMSDDEIVEALTREGHDNVNFEPALREFGLLC